MATKIKPVKGKAPSAAKMIKAADIGKAKTTPEAKTFYNRVNRALSVKLKKSYIPTLIEFNRSPDRVSTYFLNRKLYETILGDRMSLMDRAMTTAICECITDEIMTDITEGSTNYPGIWDWSSVLAITRPFVKISYVPGGETFLGPYDKDVSGRKFAEIQGSAPTTIMVYSEYSENKLYEFAKNVADTVMTVIAHEMKVLPLALYQGKDMPIYLRYADEFHTLIYPKLQPWRDALYDSVKAQLEAELAALSETLNLYMPFILSEAGFSPNAVLNTIKIMHWTAVYQNSRNNPDAYDPDTTINYVVTVKPELAKEGIAPPTFTLEFRAVDIAAFGDPTEKMTKKVRMAMGRTLMGFLENLVTFIFNVHIQGYLSE